MSGRRVLPAMPPSCVARLLRLAPVLVLAAACAAQPPPSATRVPGAPATRIPLATAGEDPVPPIDWMPAPPAPSLGDAQLEHVIPIEGGFVAVGCRVAGFGAQGGE